MSSLISCHEVAKTYGEAPLFQGISLNVAQGDRIGIIGPNGCGKTTLLKILAGLELPDSGERTCDRALRVGFVPQDTALDPELTVEQAVGQAFHCSGPWTDADETERQVQVQVALTKLGFVDSQQLVGSLSGGWIRRLAIARALAVDPEVLFLDEPTNHLDLHGILWLEKLLLASRFALVMVSHDRAFLEAVATQVMELNRVFPGGSFCRRGSYSDYLQSREGFLAGQARYQQALDNRVRREVEWLRRGPKARTSKSRGRIQEAQRLMAELARLKEDGRQQRSQIDFTPSGRKSKRLLTARGLEKTMGARKLFSGLDLLLRPGMRLGLVGANGSGKSTLLRLLADQLQPDRGVITRADELQVVYFDQTREHLDPHVTLRRALAPEGDSVVYRGQAVHVISWAKRFLFKTDQLQLPVGRLSGGEQAKLLIARLMLRPADLLLLDEPTNDLDLPTLEVLEDSLTDFPGALVLVTHDRYMLDRLCSLLVALEGDGQVTLYADYAQWEQAIEQRGQAARLTRRQQRAQPPKRSRPRTLSYWERREYEGMEEAILSAESELEMARQALEDPAIASDTDKLGACYQALRTAEARVEHLYERWAELEART